MSRHLVIDRPDLQVVLGFDHMLRSFFGQVFNPSDARGQGIARAGWPTKSGLGTRRPAQTHAEAEEDLNLLIAWTLKRKWEHADSLVWSAHIARVRVVLLREWDDGVDAVVSPQIPAILNGEA